MPMLEDALDEAGVHFRAESMSLVYEAAEVRDLLITARAIADPSDELALVAALRSPLFGCGDDDLWRWKHCGARVDLFAKAKDDALAEGPVGPALAYLTKLHRAARWLTPSEVLARIVEDRRVLELGAHLPRTRDSWRRIRFVVDQARAWTEVSHGGLRAYLDWVAHQAQEKARVSEAVLPEQDVDAVRVMTVHAAKGLEFPIVILSGMSTRPRREYGVRLLWGADDYAVSLRKDLRDPSFEGMAASMSRWTTRAHPAAVRRCHSRPRPPRRLAAPHPARQRRPAHACRAHRGRRRRHGHQPVPLHARPGAARRHPFPKRQVLHRTSTTG